MDADFREIKCVLQSYRLLNRERDTYPRRRTGVLCTGQVGVVFHRDPSRSYDRTLGRSLVRVRPVCSPSPSYTGSWQPFDTPRASSRIAPPTHASFKSRLDLIILLWHRPSTFPPGSSFSTCTICPPSLLRLRFFNIWRDKSKGLTCVPLVMYIMADVWLTSSTCRSRNPDLLDVWILPSVRQNVDCSWGSSLVFPHVRKLTGSPSRLSHASASARKTSCLHTKRVMHGIERELRHVVTEIVQKSDSSSDLLMVLNCTEQFALIIPDDKLRTLLADKSQNLWLIFAVSEIPSFSLSPPIHRVHRHRRRWSWPSLISFLHNRGSSMFASSSCSLADWSTLTLDAAGRGCDSDFATDFHVTPCSFPPPSRELDASLPSMTSRSRLWSRIPVLMSLARSSCLTRLILSVASDLGSSFRLLFKLLLNPFATSFSVVCRIPNFRSNATATQTLDDEISWGWLRDQCLTDTHLCHFQSQGNPQRCWQLRHALRLETKGILWCSARVLFRGLLGVFHYTFDYQVICSPSKSHSRILRKVFSSTRSKR